MILIFVIGCGRSGTNLVGRILGSHPRIGITIEEEPQFSLSGELAYHPDRAHVILPQLKAIYAEKVEQADPLIYADKSHALIWAVPELIEMFPRQPRARFVAVRRGNCMGTIASMLEHGSTPAWAPHALDLGRHRRIHGIYPPTEELLHKIFGSEIPMECRLYLIWRTHHIRLQCLLGVYPQRVHVVSYESLVLDTERVLDDLSAFLGVDASGFAPEEVDSAPLTKWHSRLTAEQKKNVRRLALDPGLDALLLKVVNL